MENNNKYIIQGGEEGKSRLKVLSETLLPYTDALFRQLEVGESKSFFDVGCGGGYVSLHAAKMMGNGGTVTAIDFDPEIIRLARQDVQFSDVTNITFEVMSAYEIPYQNQFDIAYARFLLSHLTEPLDVLKKMAKSVKPGGKVIVEDIHFSGHFCYPKCDAFDRYVQYFTKAAINSGHNAEIGPSLFSLFQNAGINNIGFDVVAPCFNSGAGKWMAHITLHRIKNTLIRQGIATAQTIDAMLQELEDFTNDETTIISMPHIFRVWGTSN